MRTTITILLAAACSGASTAPPVPAAADNPVAPTVVQETEESIRADLDASMASVMKPSVDPCEDFYQYACGGWLETTVMPADKSRMTRAFANIDDRNKDLLKKILEDAAKGTNADPAWQKVGVFNKACLDDATADARGADPVKPNLDLVAGVTDIASLAKVSGMLAAMGTEVLFSFDTWADLKEPSTNILYVGQGGQGLPDREYYLDKSDEKKNLRDAYVAHVARMMQLGGYDEASAAKVAADVLAFETKLATASFPRAELRDPVATYHKIDRAGLQKLMPKFPLDAFFEGLGAPGIQAISVEKEEYFTALGKTLAETKPEMWKNYLSYRVLTYGAMDLSKAFQDEDFGFYGATLSGQKEPEARWKQCAEKLDNSMGDLLGQAYVDRAFGGDSKPIATDMIRRVEQAFEGGLPDLEWMDDKTRGRAKEKAASIKNKIGYPDTWKSYDSLVLEEGKHFENMTAGKKFKVAETLAKVGKPVDPGEWHMTASTVNAYYSPTENEIVFPAGILQPPMFHRSWPMAANFGGMGLVMGHEISHGFDDGGRQFDATGKLEDWWEASSTKAFESKAQCVIDSYSGFEAKPGLNVNGELTLGENIADIGGARFAFRAYRKWVEENGAEQPVAGLDPEKVFFVNFAQNWCSLITDEALEMQVRTDSHSPARFRVNGALSHTPEFHEVFECAEGSAMRPAAEDVCVVW